MSSIDGLKIRYAGNPNILIPEDGSGTVVGKVYVKGGIRFQVGPNQNDWVRGQLARYEYNANRKKH